MQVKILIQDLKDAGTPLFPEMEKAGFKEGQLESFGILEGGTVGGKASVGINVKMPDGTYVWVQTTADIFEGMAAALRGARQRWAQKN